MVVDFCKGRPNPCVNRKQLEADEVVNKLSSAKKEQQKQQCKFLKYHTQPVSLILES